MHKIAYNNTQTHTCILTHKHTYINTHTHTRLTCAELPWRFFGNIQTVVQVDVC